MKRNSKVYALGASGFVGGGLKKCGLEFTDFSLPDLNITDEESVRGWAEKIPDNSGLFYLAAYTDVDGAERDPGLARKINIEGLKNVLNALRGRKKIFICYLSSDMVFAGAPDDPGPYMETAIPTGKGIGVYAQTKLEAERIINESGFGHAIVRISFPTGDFSSPKDYLRKLQAGIEKGYSMFTDQQITPTWLPDLADAVQKIIELRKIGIFNVTTRSVATPFEITELMSEKMKLGKVKSGSIYDYLKKPGIAPRPVCGGLDCTQTQKELELTFLSWQDVAEEFCLFLTHPRGVLGRHPGAIN